MFLPILYGFLLGTALCLTFGTVFFALIQNSVDNGFRSGLKIIFGVIVGDALFVLAALLGTSFIPKVQGFEHLMAVVGVLFLTAMGLVNILSGTPRLAYPQTRFGNFVYYFSTGFFLNALNPVNFISWVTIVAYIRSHLHYAPGQQYGFMIAALIGVFVTESALAYYANRLKRLFTPRVVTLFNRTTGFVFLAVAAQIAYTRLYQPITQMMNW
ncbi:LysE family translocator [Spirosoma montaniterrae]|uniref:Lysine transporter LysE n=1 Tax=Spirosoma montaniterrae TaxID=1178516 RepID=A0A1P9WTZ6_9BACT|nr:LysE family transporter [Spirosoma montaniterrae]AQG78839.1 lysine transporter LysE [Spirosoma montaniterrae]